jgi:hypothetical protein
VDTTIKKKKRKVNAPADDWLTKAEVMTWFGIGDSLLQEWIAAGLFPAGHPWTGNQPRWEWIDVAYREFYLRVEARLARTNEPGIARTAPNEPEPARRGTKAPGSPPGA